MREAIWRQHLLMRMAEMLLVLLLLLLLVVVVVKVLGRYEWLCLCRRVVFGGGSVAVERSPRV